LRDSNAYGHRYGFANGDADTDANADSGNADTDAHLRAGSVMGDCCTSAYCALRNQRNFRWYVLLFNRRL
jgi:hypothetical protein